MGANSKTDIETYFYQFCSWQWDSIPAFQMVLVIQFYPEWLEFPFSFAWGKHFIANRVWKIEVFIVFPSVAASRKVKECEEWLFESWVKAEPSGEERASVGGGGRTALCSFPSVFHGTLAIQGN